MLGTPQENQVMEKDWRGMSPDLKEVGGLRPRENRLKIFTRRFGGSQFL